LQQLVLLRDLLQLKLGSFNHCLSSSLSIAHSRLATQDALEVGRIKHLNTSRQEILFNSRLIIPTPQQKPAIAHIKQL
jgi:hypothetical protein